MMNQTATAADFPLLPKVHVARGPLTAGALVLEGGAARGIYTAGVCDVLMEQGIHMQCVAGVSAGALNGWNIMGRQVGRYASIALLHCRDKRHTGWKAILSDRGYVGFAFMFGSVNDEFPFDASAIDDPARRFVSVSTDLKTGRPFYGERGSCSSVRRAAIASASYLGISRAVRLDGHKLLDGCHSAILPFDWAVEQGYRKQIVVLTREREHRKGPMSEKELHLLHTLYGGYPAFCKSVEQTQERYASLRERICAAEAAGEAFVIAPRGPVTVKRIERDQDKLYELYVRGRKDAEEALPALRAYLARP